MSKIGKINISIPEKVKVALAGNILNIVITLGIIIISLFVLFLYLKLRATKKNTMELIMIKYGWKPFLTTRYPITGPSRPNTQFCLGKYKGKSTKKIRNRKITEK